MTADSVDIQTSAFDDVATSYDSTFTTTSLGRRLRSIVWRRFDSCFEKGGRLLDVGCGTGEDAVHLASRGFHVVATDVSGPMLELAKKKAQRAGCLNRVNFRRVPMEDLGKEFAHDTFDGVYSNFGVINCVHSLEPTLAVIAGLMTDNARLVLVVMGRHVPWEWAWFAARADFQKAFRRTNREGAVWRGQTIRYPSPNSLKRAMAQHLVTLQCQGLGIALPPSYASAWLERSPRLFRMLSRMEDIVSKWQQLAAIGDHYILEARRGAVASNG